MKGVPHRLLCTVRAKRGGRGRREAAGERRREHAPRKLLCTVHVGERANRANEGQRGQTKGETQGREQEKEQGPKCSMPRSVLCILCAPDLLLEPTHDKRGRRVQVRQKAKG